MKNLFVKLAVGVSLVAVMAPGSYANSVHQCASTYCAAIGAGSACHTSPYVRQVICGG